MSLDQEMFALAKRILSNRCDACGKTPTIKTEVGIGGRLVFSVCGDCAAVGSFTIRQPSELLVSGELASVLSGGSFSIDPSAFLRSPELAVILYGEYPASLLLDMTASGRIQ
jgi:hypothetical protein